MKPYSRKQSPTEINEKRYIPNFVLRFQNKKKSSFKKKNIK